MTRDQATPVMTLKTPLPGSTPRIDAVAAHADDYLDSDRDGTAHGPDRETERRAIEALTG